MMNPKLIKMAREGLGLSQAQLAMESKLSVRLIGSIETGAPMTEKTETLIRYTLKRLGVEIIDEPNRYGVIVHKEDVGGDTIISSGSVTSGS